jgi:thermitase
MTALLTVAAFLLMAWDASRRNRQPLVVLAGLGLLGLSFTAHVVSGNGLLQTTSSLLAETGLGLVLAALVMLVRRATARPFLVLGLLSLLLSGLVQGGARLFGADTTGETETASFLLELGPDDHIAEVQAVLDRYAARAEQAFPSLSQATEADLAQVYLVHAPAHTHESLMADLGRDAENVDFVEPNDAVSLDPQTGAALPERTPVGVQANDPMIGQQWAMEAIHGHEAHAFLKTATPTRKAVVAILDTGVEGRHADLGGVFGNSPASDDQHGHGTHCAGIAGAATNNGTGIASLNWEGRFVEVRGYRALNERGFGTTETIAQAVIDATQAGVDVISMSLGDAAPIPPRVMVEAVQYALRKGVIVVTSAGNANQDAARHMPSNIEGVIVVAAVDQQLAKARFSNTNTSLQRPIAAPGVDILSLKPGGTYVPMSGTSMATPMVAGLIGVMRALQPDLSAEQAWQTLHDTGTTTPATNQVGRVINAAAALQHPSSPL